MRSLKKCFHCGIDFEGGIQNFCSKVCIQLHFDGRVREAVDNDDSHTENLS